MSSVEAKGTRGWALLANLDQVYGLQCLGEHRGVVALSRMMMAKGGASKNFVL